MAAGTGVPKVSSALFSGTSTDSPSADEVRIIKYIYSCFQLIGNKIVWCVCCVYS